MSGMNKKKLLKFVKGFRGRAKNCPSVARERAYKALQYAFVGRKLKKRLFRETWIQQINAATRIHDLSYSRFMQGCVLSDVKLNRKMLSELAIYEPYSFSAVTKLVGERLKKEEVAKEVERRAAAKKNIHPGNRDLTADQKEWLLAQKLKEMQIV
ncbi:ribosomal protein L20, putative [Acanthamoeba castellanii str. Neff]|uniref:Ribosomal protein L20, putative n=1 Tax=Acanthamoeba castellanii (strain ATCC 30010 / Neff) TaxID=1257118 RepID=L8HB15_ACACF|nr:ribosomal protein L20, putative [Acanthamoeba castellanii str. Neff]ELR21923.1 ribosomal protein L20, putative [Acanthamoeba castellanii str. Neff]